MFTLNALLSSNPVAVMKHSVKAKKKHDNRPAPANPIALPQARTSPKRWAVLGLGLVLACGGTWAFMEFVIWNKLPSELVGDWEVVQGPPEYKDAVFEFYRSGKMVGRLNDRGNLRIMNAYVQVEGDKIFITTRRPSTGEEHVSVQTVRSLNDRELVVADERGEIMRMRRMP
jgi:uncharacterized protein (TIGR03066 family)